MSDKEKVLAGRKAVDRYREAHRLLHQKPYYREVHADHTPLLNKMLDAFKKAGFNSLQEFFMASEELNVRELGFTTKEDIKTKADMEALERMWK